MAPGEMKFVFALYAEILLSHLGIIKSFAKKFIIINALYAEN